MRYCLLLFIMCSSFVLSSQDIVYEDHIYLDHIRSVKFHHERLETSQPIIDLGSRGRLRLTFDDILGGDRTYTYKIVHCDKDWHPSDISEMDYLEGFNDERIREYEYSSGTKYDYTNYSLTLPNDELGWRLSGNYLLIITDDDSDEIALTRRFMVSERQVSIGVQLDQSRRVNRMLYDQALEVSIDNKRYPIDNPQNELYMTIMQNGRWDNAMTNIQPKIALRNLIQFDRTANISFPGYNEFRGVDIRTFRTRGLGVYSIDVFEDEIDVLLAMDTKRSNIVFQNYEDLNGDFIITTLEYPNGHIRSEYVNTHFTIESRDQILDGDVYVVGAFTDWQPQEEFRLKYDLEKRVYYGSGLLKQGYYDYQYMIKYDDGTVDCEYFEGSSYVTDNQYHILVYQRTFAKRYDRLIGVTSVTSNFGG